jgi:cation:H+ antiporter
LDELITSTCTSIPELVTAVAAVRQGSLTLAVGGIVGGNAFDTLFMDDVERAHAWFAAA